MHYPMLKFFPASSRLHHMGVTVNKGKNVEEIRSTMVEILREEHVEGGGPVGQTLQHTETVILRICGSMFLNQSNL
jgi:hypothetical protein